MFMPSQTHRYSALIVEPAQAFTDSCRGLREDAIRLMQLQLDTPAVTACLWPTWESDPGAAPMLFTTDLEAKRIFVYALPREFIRRVSVERFTELFGCWILILLISKNIFAFDYIKI